MGVNLTNYHCVFHPSQPNYVASIGGTKNGVIQDYRADIKSSQRTIIDVLHEAGISWGVYNEDMPYTGFNGTEFKSAKDRNDYVRRHK